MMKAIPIILFALAIGVTIAVWPSGTDSVWVDVSMRVDGPDGLWFEGDLRAISAFGAIQSIAQEEGWDFVVDGREGSCFAYVKEINGIGEEGAGGWVYEIKRNGTWTGPIYTSADCTFLENGDLIWWHWSASGEYEAEKEWEE